MYKCSWSFSSCSIIVWRLFCGRFGVFGGRFGVFSGLVEEGCFLSIANGRFLVDVELFCGCCGWLLVVALVALSCQVNQS